MSIPRCSVMKLFAEACKYSSDGDENNIEMRLAHIK